MNKSLALLVMPALLLTGCASGPAATEPAASAATVTPTASHSATPKPMQTPTPTREEQIKKIYLDGIYESEPALRAAGVGDDLISIGQGFCKMYDGGAKGSDINKYILTAAGWAYTVGQLASVHGAAVGVYCPEHIEKMGL